MNMTARSVPPSGSAAPCFLKVGYVAQHILAAILSLSLIMPPAGAWGETAGTAPQAASPSKYNPEQLDAMLAPIALYPDDLLVQTLMAATYPLQIVEAARWLETDDNKNLKGDALAKALEPLKWDPSVKSLVPFPQVLDQLNQYLDWTQQIGCPQEVRGSRRGKLQPQQLALFRIGARQRDYGRFGRVCASQLLK